MDTTSKPSTSSRSSSLLIAGASIAALATAVAAGYMIYSTTIKTNKKTAVKIEPKMRTSIKQNISLATLKVPNPDYLKNALSSNSPQFYVLKLDTTFSEDVIEPLFSGATWAGSVVWSASVRLCDYLYEITSDPDSHRVALKIKQNENSNNDTIVLQESIRGKIVVELGAGIGSCGFTAALLGARKVIVTEQKPLDSLLHKNIESNKVLKNCSATLLDWYTFNNISEIGLDVYPDVILISDCIYSYLYGDSWKQLLRVLMIMCKPNHTLVYNSVERREIDDGIDLFNDLAIQSGFKVDMIRDEILVESENEHLQLYRMVLLHQ